MANPARVDEKSIRQLLDAALVGRDPHDFFPWTWRQYSDDVRVADEGSICTPNGCRPDGTMHTYWHIAGDIPPGIGDLICRVVNGVAALTYGTPVR